MARFENPKYANYEMRVFDRNVSIEGQLDYGTNIRSSNYRSKKNRYGGTIASER